MIPSVKSPRHPNTLSRAALAVLIIATVVAAAVLSSQSVSSQGDDRQRRDLDRVFSRHERLSLDPGQIQRQVKQTRSLTLTTSRGKFEMTLEPHDMRAPGYRAEAWGDQGVTVLERGPVRTYKGTVQGLPGAQARMTIDEGTVEGLIVTPSELFFLEPSKRFSASAAKTDFVFYAASDVKEAPGQCGNTMAEMVEQHSANVSNKSSAKGPLPEALFDPQLEIALAAESDFEYYTALGSSAAAVEQRILETMSAVEGIYSSQLGLQFSFSVSNLRVWSTAGDPYTSPVAPATTVDASTALNQFRGEYNTSPPAGAAGRDIAHLFTGRNIASDNNTEPSTIGIAFQPGLDCPLDPADGFGYGMSENRTVAAERPILTAHEIAHNLNASHVNSDNGSDCTSSIMGQFLTVGVDFCQYSKNEITNHANATRGCLTALTGCTYGISPSSPQNFPMGGGTGSISLTTGAGCTWTVAEGTDWLTITAGGSGTGSGTVNYSIAPNDGICGPRTALVNIGGQILTVTQAGKPDYLTDPATATAITPFQTVNGNLSSSDCQTGIVDPGDNPPTVRVNAFMDRYKFFGMAGQKIRIQMNATGGLDTYLYLYGPDGNLVPNGENDDLWLPPNGNQTNSRIPCTNIPTGPCAVEFLTLTQTGTYIIIATSYSSGDSGGYSLTLTSEPLLLTAQVTDNVGTGAALNSVTFARTSNATNTAFSIVDTHNFSADQTTRLILFTSDLGLIQQQNPASNLISVSAGGHPLVVENVGPFMFPGLNGTYIVVALKRNDGGPMPTGSLAFTVTTATLTSNVATITIAP